MRLRKGKLIPAILAAMTVLLGAYCLFVGNPSAAADDASVRITYLERICECMTAGVNPLSDEEVEQTVRMRLSGFALTEDEADAIIKTLNNPGINPAYRELYLLSLFDYECNTKENHATSYYSAQDNTVHIGKNVAPNNFVATFFHESGHAIEISLWAEIGSDADKVQAFRFPEELTAYDALSADVGSMIENCLDEMENAEYTTLQKQLVADAFINGSQADEAPADLPDDEENGFLKLAYEYVAESLSDSMAQIPNSNASMVSDVYGGVTNNKILGGMGHPAVKVGADGTSFYYWYDEQGNTTYNQLTEAWAEFFSAMITGDTLNIEYNEEYFPSACRAFDELEGSLLTFYSGLADTRSQEQ